MLSEYKSNRAKAPPGFGADLRNLQQLLHFMRVSTVVAPGFEADDVIGGVAQTASKEGYAVRIYSSDMDLYQVGTSRPHESYIFLLLCQLLVLHLDLNLLDQSRSVT